MLTAIVIILLCLFLFNWRGHSNDSLRDPLWTILIILLIVWLLFATGVIGEYGYHW